MDGAAVEELRSEEEVLYYTLRDLYEKATAREPSIVGHVPARLPGYPI